MKHYNKKYLVLFHDAVMINVAWLAAFWLRFNLGEIPQDPFIAAYSDLPLVFSIQAISCFSFGLYRGNWRFASMPDLARILKAVTAGVCMTAVALFFYNRLANVPRSVFPMYSLLLVALFGGPRFIFRWLKDYGNIFSSGERVLIVGSGQAGESAVRDLLRDTHGAYNPIAFVDDAIRKLGQDIHGIRVVADCTSIPSVVKQYNIEMIVIAIPSARSQNMRRIVELCEQTDVPFLTLPSLNDLATGRVSLNTMREVLLEDLLGRDQVTLDWDQINDGLTGKKIVVTGGGGSIGSELCRQIAQLMPSQLIIIDNSEYNLYMIEK